MNGRVPLLRRFLPPSSPSRRVPLQASHSHTTPYRLLFPPSTPLRRGRPHCRPGMPLRAPRPSNPNPPFVPRALSLPPAHSRVWMCTLPAHPFFFEACLYPSRAAGNELTRGFARLGRLFSFQLPVGTQGDALPDGSLRLHPLLSVKVAAMSACGPLVTTRQEVVASTHADPDTPSRAFWPRCLLPPLPFAPPSHKSTEAFSSTHPGQNILNNAS